MSTRKKIAVSGGFDPLHIGHLRMIKDAAQFGDVYVILNSDEFLFEKKGRVFMPFEERREILQALRYVHRVVPCIDHDHTVCATLRQLAPDIFANGGDRLSDNIPERDVCNELKIQMLFEVGGGKIKSSSELCEQYEIQKDSVGMVA